MDLDRFASRRSSIYGKKGMVACSQALATAAGLEMLRAGGSAADASVAVAAALNVTEPCSTGIGGDMFALYRSAITGRVEALNGSGRCPRSLDLDRLEREGFSLEGGLPPLHPYSITVPGACAGWMELLARHGRLPVSTVLAPAIALAEEGFPVAPITSYFWKRGAIRQLAASLGGAELSLDGRGPEAGEIFRNPGLARTLRLVAEGGAAAFYEGPIAESIVDVVRRSGGCLDAEDLASHRSTWEVPIDIDYRGYRFHECPPNGQGIAALLALRILEGFDIGGLAPLSPRRLHLEIEALRLAFADARWWAADPAFAPAPIEELLSEPYARERRALIDPKKATIDTKRGSPLASSETVYFCVVDGSGDACSFVNSNYMGFGTGIVPTGCGFSLQNRGCNFSLDRKHPNRLEPGKRPYHTIIPALITRATGRAAISAGVEESLSAVFGVMGGFMQPQGHVQVGLALVDGLDPQTALDLPRFCIDIAGPSAGGPVLLEEGLPDETVEGLAAYGHRLKRVSGWERAAFGRGQIISSSDSGCLVGGSDPRADGLAMTLA